MNRSVLVAAAFVLAGFMAVASFAQPAAAQAPASKVGIIDSQAFAADKDGITKYVNGLRALNTEFAPRTKELQDLGARIQKIADELKAMTSNTAVPFNQAAAQAKQDEGERLQREYEFKKKELEEAINKRSEAVLGPIQADIGKAIQDFATQKGYTMIFDLDKLGPSGAILALDPKANITKEFIAYYNTRPATTATTAAPR